LSSTLLPGFTGSESSDTNRGSATLCSFPVGGSPFTGRLYGPIGNLRIHSSRASRGKTHHLLVCRPAPVRFGLSDIGTRLVSSARPPPRTHLAGSLFATYTSSASCFLRTSRFWRCPCLVGVVLPSDTVDFQSGVCAMPGAREIPRFTRNDRCPGQGEGVTRFSSLGANSLAAGGIFLCPLPVHGYRVTTLPESGSKACLAGSPGSSGDLQCPSGSMDPPRCGSIAPSAPLRGNPRFARRVLHSKGGGNHVPLPSTLKHVRAADGPPDVPPASERTLGITVMPPSLADGQARAMVESYLNRRACLRDTPKRRHPTCGKSSSSWQRYLGTCDQFHSGLSR